MSGYHDHYSKLNKWDKDFRVSPVDRSRNTWFDMLALGVMYGSVVAIAAYILGGI